MYTSIIVDPQMKHGVIQAVVAGKSILRLRKSFEDFASTPTGTAQLPVGKNESVVASHTRPHLHYWTNSIHPIRHRLP